MPDFTPIFFDPETKRWPRVRAGLFALGLVCTLLLGALSFTVIANPSIEKVALPALGRLRLRPPRSRFHEEERRLSREISARALEPGALAPESRSRGAAPVSAAFLVNWDPAGIDSFEAHIGELDMVIAEWLHVKGAAGGVTEDNPELVSQILAYVKDHKPSLEVVALVNNFSNGAWQGAQADALLASPAARTALAGNLLSYAESKNLKGITIDFEDIARRDDFSSFIKELSDAAHARGMIVGVNVPGASDTYDYARLAAAADYVNLMMYDEHWQTSRPGPISGMDWFLRVMELRRKEIPADKMMVSLGNYSYDWPAAGGAAESASFSDTIVTAKESEGDIVMDDASLNPTFDYFDDRNALHHVWLLDAATFFNELAAVEGIHPYGVSLWRLGSEDPSIWNFFGKAPFEKASASGQSGQPLGQTEASSLANYSLDGGIDYTGSGEILSVTETPQNGLRDIQFDSARGLIVDEHYRSFAANYGISRYGAAKKKIALTFDDGPDPQYTPQILSILEDKNAPATFFIVGVNGERYPSIISQAWSDGNEIGNHTFTHPNIAEVSDLQIKLELSTTEHLIEGVTGRTTHLFRPPYAIDAEPQNALEAHPLEVASNLGYLTVGMQIDPSDWQKPGVQAIVDRVLSHAAAGYGNVVLLHDGGGDRSETVAALPQIIDGLRARGFELVTIAGLLRKPESAIMSPVEDRGLIYQSGDVAGFGLITFAETMLATLFLVAIILGFAHFVFVMIFALFHSRKRRKKLAAERGTSLGNGLPGTSAAVGAELGANAASAVGDYRPGNHQPSVAVLVPAYNEGKVVDRTIRSLLAADHPDDFEIIAVDDGSTDDTWDVMQKKFSGNQQVKLFRRENGGKASALNYGLARTRAEIIISLDADTIFTKQTIRLLLRHFSDLRVGAVAGNTKVGNRVNLLTRWQALEYITSQNLDRRSFEILNSITVVPGAVGAWRREALERAGGWSPATLAEDADLTLAVHGLGYQIVYEDRAIGLTEAPDTVRALLKQRFRWTYGMLQVTRKYLRAFFNPEYGLMGFVVMPYIFFYQVVFPFLGPIVDAIFLASFAWTAVSLGYHPSTFEFSSIQSIVYFYALFLLMDFASAAMAMFLEKNEDRTLLVWLFFQRFFYRQVMYYVAVKSMFTALKGKRVGWGKLERKATVRS